MRQTVGIREQSSRGMFEGHASLTAGMKQELKAYTISQLKGEEHCQATWFRVHHRGSWQAGGYQMVVTELEPIRVVAPSGI